MTSRRATLTATALLAVLGLLLAGCAPAVQDEVGQNYISGDGTVSEFSVDSRGDAIEFTGTIEDGSTVTAGQFRGQVLVVNFWYASCPPCRLEAPWLQELNEEFADKGVQFLGANIRDGSDTALAFATKFGITYPSVIDSDGGVALALSGIASPTAVPTTVVLDRQGRPASRIVGLLEKSTLKALIASALDEEKG